MLSIVDIKKINHHKSSDFSYRDFETESIIKLIGGIWEEFLSDYETQFKHSLPEAEFALKHLSKLHGKMFRPMIYFLIQGLLGQKRLVYPHVAVIIELLHLVGIVHDDVIDESDLRRGEASLNSQLGNHVAVLVGDYFMVKMLELSLKINVDHFLPIVTHASKEMIEGEIEQAFLIKTEQKVVQKYLSILKKKTASLFGAVSELSGLISGADETMRKDLVCFGVNFGMAFQIRDDILDLESHSDVLGKPSGQDILSWLNLPILFALENADSKTILRFQQSTGQGQLSKIRLLVEELDGFKNAQSLAEEYTNQCLYFLGEFPNSPFKGALESMILKNMGRSL